jgi:hypothetical protein
LVLSDYKLFHFNEKDPGFLKLLFAVLTWSTLTVKRLDFFFFIRSNKLCKVNKPTQSQRKKGAKKK